MLIIQVSSDSFRKENSIYLFYLSIFIILLLLLFFFIFLFIYFFFLRTWDFNCGMNLMAAYIVGQAF